MLDVTDGVGVTVPDGVDVGTLGVDVGVVTLGTPDCIKEIDRKTTMKKWYVLSLKYEYKQNIYHETIHTVLRERHKHALCEMLRQNIIKKYLFEWKKYSGSWKSSSEFMYNIRKRQQNLKYKTYQKWKIIKWLKLVAREMSNKHRISGRMLIGHVFYNEMKYN